MDTVEMTFEQAIIRLEEIVKLLEKGDAPLDKSLALFEEGSSLLRICNSMLDGAEQKVMMLTKSETGANAIVPFVTDDEG